MQASARYQEGEEPAEDAQALLAEADEIVVRLEELIRRINRTNASHELSPGVAITDAIARRDVLRIRRTFYAWLAYAAAGQQCGRVAGFQIPCPHGAAQQAAQVTAHTGHRTTGR